MKASSLVGTGITVFYGSPDDPTSFEEGTLNSATPDRWEVDRGQITTGGSFSDTPLFVEPSRDSADPHFGGNIRAGLAAWFYIGDNLTQGIVTETTANGTVKVDLGEGVLAEVGIYGQGVLIQVAAPEPEEAPEPQGLMIAVDARIAVFENRPNGAGPLMVGTFLGFDEASGTFSLQVEDQSVKLSGLDPTRWSVFVEGDPFRLNAGNGDHSGDLTVVLDDAAGEQFVGELTGLDHTGPSICLAEVGEAGVESEQWFETDVVTVLVPYVAP